MYNIYVTQFHRFLLRRPMNRCLIAEVYLRRMIKAVMLYKVLVAYRQCTEFAYFVENFYVISQCNFIFHVCT